MKGTDVSQSSEEPCVGSNGSSDDELVRLRAALAERIEFIEDMSHELRSGLTFIRGYVDLALGGSLGEINDRQRHALEVMSRRTEAIIYLLDQMLSLERARAGHLELVPMVDLTEVVQHSVQSAIVTANDAGIDLRFKTKTHCLMESADPRRLIQVMDNLIGNAIKFSHRGGSVNVALQKKGGQAEITVSDQGIGIAAEDLDRIFDRFYRTREGAGRASGSGLGLEIVKAIVEAHGGKVWAESTLGEGTTFHVVFPAKCDNELEPNGAHPN